MEEYSTRVQFTKDYPPPSASTFIDFTGEDMELLILLTLIIFFIMFNHMEHCTFLATMPTGISILASSFDQADVLPNPSDANIQKFLFQSLCIGNASLFGINVCKE